MVLDTVPAQDALAVALRHHQAGRLEQAGLIYREILRANPAQPDALHLIGLIAHQIGNLPDAIDYIGRAISAQPNVAMFHNNLATVYLAASRLEQAVASCERCLEITPDFPEAHNNLGNALLALGKIADAARNYEQALSLRPSYIEACYNLGNVRREQGRFDEAIACYERVVQANPDFADVHVHLGDTLRRAGKPRAAVASLQRAIAVRPDHLEAQYQLGNVYRMLGEPEAAAACFRQCVQVDPDFTEAYSNLGSTLRELGRLDDAVSCYRRALTLKPDAAEIHHNLGNALRRQGRVAEAVECYRRAIALKPKYAQAHSSLGAALTILQRWDEAVAHCQRAAELTPQDPDAFSNLGHALRFQGKLDDAASAFQRAISLGPAGPEVLRSLAEIHREQGRRGEAIDVCRQLVARDAEDAAAWIALANSLTEAGRLAEAVPCSDRAIELDAESVEAFNNLGNALADLKRLDEAARAFQQAIGLKPDSAELCSNLASVFKEQGRLEDSIAYCRRALALDREYAPAHNNLAVALKAQGKMDEAVECYEQVLALMPDDAKTHSNALACKQYLPNVSLAELARAHAEWNKRHAEPLRGDPAARDEQLDRPLRLGFVSPDLCRHPVGYFLIGVLTQIDRRQFATICYSDRAAPDDMTSRLKAAATEWRDVRGLSDETLAETIRQDRVDILFDLCGHFADHRLLVFARKPAPVQVTWAGYVGTTGLESIDYLLSDRWETPEGVDEHFAERIMRLPHGYVCWEPPTYAPPVGPLPALTRGVFTFGSFNNPCKISHEVVAVWAEILRATDRSRLLLKFKGFDDDGTRRRYQSLFAARGVDVSRIELQGPSPHAQLLATYNQLDLALDPFPYAGGLTTCEALWMGVPVITYPGQTFAGRHSLSHMSNIGLSETICTDLDDYVRRAVAMSSDLSRLAYLRRSLRDWMLASPLVDHRRFIAGFESALREMWRSR